MSIEVPTSHTERITRDQAVPIARASGSALGWLAAVARRAVSGGVSVLWKRRCAQAVMDEADREHLRRLEFAAEYARGYVAGWKECFRACQEAIEESYDGGWNN